MTSLPDSAMFDWQYSAKASNVSGIDDVFQRSASVNAGCAMKKLKHEGELFKAALQAGMKYAEDRKAAIFEPKDSVSERLLFIYRLLVLDKKIQPLPEDQVAEATMRHKLALWYAKQLPKDHPLLK